MPDRLTPAQLADLERLEQAATPGSWTAQRPSWRRGYGLHKTAITAGPRHTVANAFTETSYFRFPEDAPEPGPDAIFIAAARNALPDMLADLRDARAERDAMRAVVEAAREWRNATDALQHLCDPGVTSDPLIVSRRWTDSVEALNAALDQLTRATAEQSADEGN